MLSLILVERIRKSATVGPLSSATLHHTCKSNSTRLPNSKTLFILPSSEEGMEPTLEIIQINSPKEFLPSLNDLLLRLSSSFLIYDTTYI
jgi:hypothetical protein